MSDSLLSEIDHVAIAVRDLEAAIAWYAEVFGAVVVHREFVESDGVEEALIGVADSFIQLLTPTHIDSPVQKYLDTRGEGLHHVAYRVDDCAVALEAVKAQGYRVIDQASASGIACDDRCVYSSEGIVFDAHRTRRNPRGVVARRLIFVAGIFFYLRVRQNSYFAVMQSSSRRWVKRGLRTSFVE